MPEHYGARFFGEREAAVYDDQLAGMFDPAVVKPAVDLLADLAGDGSALEFGIGTGRIALPLAARGVRVHGIDASEAMVARLRAKPGGEEIDVAIGDFSAKRVEREVFARLPRLQHDLQWAGLPAYACATAGPVGSESRSRASAPRTCPSTS